MKQCLRCHGKKVVEYTYGVPRTRACNVCGGTGQVEEGVDNCSTGVIGADGAGKTNLQKLTARFRK